MINGRELNNLGSDDDGASALQTIVDLFGESYLTLKSDTKPLSLLWNRTDRLATVELYIFGKSLQKVLVSNENWLKQTIKEMQKCPPKARGLCTEIIYFAMFEAQASKILPAAKNKPGYDFAILQKDKNNQYISIKNIDISDQQSVFQQRCRKLRLKWQEKLKLQKISLSLRILSQNFLDEDDFELIVTTIQNHKEIRPGLHLIPKEGIDLYIVNLPTSNKTSPAHLSDTVMVHCPSHASEKTRYISRIKSAVDNLYNNTKNDELAFRVLFIRMHVNADFTNIHEQTKQLVEDPSSKIDCIICYQPSYGRDEKNSSLINHCFKFEVNARFAQNAYQQYGVMKCSPPLGSVSFEQAKVQVHDLTNGVRHFIDSSDYVFQQGDIYNFGEIGEYIAMNSPAPGIREHGVCSINGRHVLISSKITPKSEDLLLI